MSSFNRLVSILVAFFLTGCGFQPLYTFVSRGDADTLDAIKISRIDDRKGQILRNYLLDSLTPYGEPSQPLYRLDVNLTVSEDAFSFRKDSTPSRLVMTSKASFNLVDLNSNKVIYSDSAEATTAFGIGPHSDYGTFPAITSQKKETERAMSLLAQEIKLQLASFLATHQPSKKPHETKDKN